MCRQELPARRDYLAMWLVTTTGFYSVVAHRGRPDQLLVRARAREDLDALRPQIPSLQPYEDPDADYRWRAVVHRDDWCRVLIRAADRIDYDNFKVAVGERHGMKREAVYHRVWQELRRIQQGR